MVLVRIAISVFKIINNLTTVARLMTGTLTIKAVRIIVFGIIGIFWLIILIVYNETK